MSTIVDDCPRCGAHRITFDLTQETLFDRDLWEAFCVCRECRQATIFLVDRVSPRPTNLPPGVRDAWRPTSGGAKPVRIVSFPDLRTTPPPEHVPPDVARVFQEGAKCVAAGCFNAAGAMFRLCLDLATKNLLPVDEAEGPDYQARRFLAPRLEWLFDNGKLPQELRDLSSVVKDDGNDAAHDGTLDDETAEDLCEFTTRLLIRLYTEPHKIRNAQERRTTRGKKKTGASS